MTLAHTGLCLKWASSQQNRKNRKGLQMLSKNCKTSIRRFDSDRRLSAAQRLRASKVEALFGAGKVFGKGFQTLFPGGIVHQISGQP